MAPALEFTLSLRKLRAEIARASGNEAGANADLLVLRELLAAADDDHPLRMWLAADAQERLKERQRDNVPVPAR